MRKYLILTLFLLLIISSSCIFDNDEKVGNDFKDAVFPLQVGNKWEYSEKFTFRQNTTPVWSNDPVESGGDTTIYMTSVLEIVGTETILGSKNTFIFREQTTEDSGNVFEGKSYYQQEDDGLYEVAYEGSGGLSLKPVAKGKFYFKGNYFNSISEINSYIHNPDSAYKTTAGQERIYSLRRALKYPLEIGTQWHYNYSDGWRQEKIVLGTEDVTVPAGTFHCFKIAWLFDYDNDGEWDDDIEFYDYICSQGLIRRVMLYKNMGLPDDPDSEIYPYDSIHDIVLTDYKLQ